MDGRPGSEHDGPMTDSSSASAIITAHATSWPGVEAAGGSRGEWAFRLGRRELGHLHGDHAAHFSFPKEVFDELLAAGRVTPHPVFPDKRGPAARAIATDADVRDVVALLRLNYDRAVARLTPEAADISPA
jgi:hypothetical protein